VFETSQKFISIFLTKFNFECKSKIDEATETNDIFLGSFGEYFLEGKVNSCCSKEKQFQVSKFQPIRFIAS